MNGFWVCGTVPNQVGVAVRLSSCNAKEQQADVDFANRVELQLKVCVSQEVTVRVPKIERGKAALTMKPQVVVASINEYINTNYGAGGHFSVSVGSTR